MSRARASRLGAALLTLAGCYATPLTPVAGPENPEVLGALRGSIVLHEDAFERDELEIYLLGRGVHRTIELDDRTDSFSNLDERGRFVYGRLRTEMWSGQLHSELRLVSMDGAPERTIYSTTNEWIRAQPALSRTGRYVAFIGGNGWIGERLCVVDLEGGEPRSYPTRTERLDDLQWLEGERALVHSGTVKREEVPEELRPFVPPPHARLPDADVPLVFVFDLETGIDRPLCFGVMPRAVPGQFAIAVAEAESRMIGTGSVFVIDAKDGRRIREPRPVPGWDSECYGSWLIAALDLDHVLYLGRPTEGTEQRSYIPGNPLFRSMKRTIKVADLSTGEFATHVPYIRVPVCRYSPSEPRLE